MLVIEKPAEGSNIIERNGNPLSQDNYVHPYLHHARLAAMLTQIEISKYLT